MYLFFYYPFEAEVAALMTAGSLQFVDEIDCTELYENYDRRERILVFEMGWECCVNEKPARPEIIRDTPVTAVFMRPVLTG